MSDKHTTGTWYVESITDTEKFHLPRGPIHQVLTIVNGYPSTVCTIEEYNEVPNFTVDRKRDARLISAAPDLLAALRALRTYNDQDAADQIKTERMVAAAIAKAGVTP